MEERGKGHIQSVSLHFTIYLAHLFHSGLLIGCTYNNYFSLDELPPLWGFSVVTYKTFAKDFSQIGAK